MRDNIGLGGGGTTHDFASVRQAALHSGAHEHIRTFESFYETVLSESYSFSESLWDDYIPDPRWGLTEQDAQNRNVPFLVKFFAQRLHASAKCRGRKVIWGDKRKDTLDTKIPKHDPKCSDHFDEATTESRAEKDISGGQWQRVALARAFMKVKDVDLLILDEPSSALDPKAEYEVFKTILELRKNKTTIYIVLSRILYNG